MGLHTFRDLAIEAGATRKMQGVVIVNVRIINDYIETMFG